MRARAAHQHARAGARAAWGLLVAGPGPLGLPGDKRGWIAVRSQLYPAARPTGMSHEARGLMLFAARKRRRAFRDREGAALERTLARLRRELIARANARGSRSRPRS